jgi:hypothetical protein
MLRVACWLAVQTNLTWLDLSFNKIQAIEGLSTLTRLQDLSLFSNAITTIEGLDNLPDLNVLSLGEPQRPELLLCGMQQHCGTINVATALLAGSGSGYCWQGTMSSNHHICAFCNGLVWHTARKPACMACMLSCVLPALAVSGSNQLSRLESVSYLVRFTNLQLLNLAGNPLAKEPDYRGYVLSHMQHLSYVDYR